jgi:hypothetical protein
MTRMKGDEGGTTWGLVNTFHFIKDAGNRQMGVHSVYSFGALKRAGNPRGKTIIVSIERL